MDIKTMIADYFTKLNWQIEPTELYEPIDYALQSGGKRIRPMLVLMAADLFGADLQTIIRPAAAMEVFHNFTLLHDDVMDHADMRRGRPTVHAKYDINTAILSGDAMLIKAYQFFEDLPDNQFRKAITLFSKTAIEVCEGQQYDANFEQRSDVSIEKYTEMIRLKTAVLLAGSLKMGAILANASDNDAQYLYDYGIAIGLAFQLRDDYLDCYGDPATFGKNIGGDILCGKHTFLRINAMKIASADERMQLASLFTNDKLSDQERIESVINLYTELGLPAICNEAIDRYYHQAIKALDHLSCPAERTQPLLDLAYKLCGRID